MPPEFWQKKQQQLFFPADIIKKSLNSILCQKLTFLKFYYTICLDRSYKNKFVYFFVFSYESIAPNVSPTTSPSLSPFTEHPSSSPNEAVGCSIYTTPISCRFSSCSWNYDKCQENCSHLDDTLVYGDEIIPHKTMDNIRQCEVIRYIYHVVVFTHYDLCTKFVVFC